MIVKTADVELDAHYFNMLLTSRGDLDTRSEVIMLLPRPSRKVLLLTKSFYPTGTFNLPSGGIHPGESPEEAFVREVAEETGLPVSPTSQIARIDHHCRFQGDSLDFTSHIILGTESSATPHPSDADECISAYMDAGIEDLLRFREHMLSLTGRWQGFGRFRATALEFVAGYLANSPIPPR